MTAQERMPLVEALGACAKTLHAPFYAPGHKRGRGISQSLRDLLGTAVFQADFPELPELDNLFAPEGVIQEAQDLAASVWEADQTWFLVNGSTAGIIAAILATCRPGDKIILPRNSHLSAISGLILSGAIPIFIQPEYQADWDLAHTVTPEAIATTLAQHPDTKAVFVVSPTYHGVCGNIEAIAQITHQYNIPLLVDEAHGAHFQFHPEFPIPALKAGADLTVQSIHKVLGAMTQASMLHIKGNRIDSQRLQRTLQFIQSSSPSYLLLASLDAARQQMALQGHALMSQTLQLAKTARQHLSQIPRLSVLDCLKPAGFFALDQTRLTVKVSDLGISGFAADEIFNTELGVTAELPTLKHLTFIITLGNTETDIEQLIQAFKQLKEKTQQQDFRREQNSALFPLTSALPPLSPRDAFFAPAEIVTRTDAAGRISAELLCPYPPGIPILMPGEVITPEALDYLHQVLGAGGTLTGGTDPSLNTLKVIKKVL